MLKDTKSRQKIILLNEWFFYVVQDIKKDLRQDHLRQDVFFIKKYCPGKNAAKLTVEELSAAYLSALKNDEKAEEIAEFIINRWIIKHADIYGFFEKELSRINPDFNLIEEIPPLEANRLMEESSVQFGALHAYLFCYLNHVAFPEEVYLVFKQKVEKEIQNEQARKQTHEETATKETLKRFYDLEISRLVDKYEKKLLGLQKKYTIDTESLKKQIASLQKKLTLNA